MIAQSDVDLSSVPKQEQEQLIAEIADAVMLTINDLLDDISKEELSTDVVNDKEEQILWQGRPFLSIAEKYIITSERIKLIKGMLARDVENYELVRIQDVDFTQRITERVFRIGDITIHGQDPSDPIIKLRNISNPEEVYEVLRKAWLEARKRHGLQFREFM